jgi:hypothetical protein
VVENVAYARTTLPDVIEPEALVVIGLETGHAARKSALAPLIGTSTIATRTTRWPSASTASSFSPLWGRYQRVAQAYPATAGASRRGALCTSWAESPVDVHSTRSVAG